MTAAYEAEVRVRVPRIAEMRTRLDRLHARPISAYAFTDHYYRPAASPWPPEQRTLPIREFNPQEAEVLFSRIALITEGSLTFKRVLHHGPASECRALLDDLGFVPWLRVRKRQGEILEIPGVGTIACEEIEGHGWWLEVEVAGTDPAAAASTSAARSGAAGGCRPDTPA